jgi:DNA invertase Pin-like site-specific DNA recombinase
LIVNSSKVIGYIRVSTEHQADSGVSLEAQRRKLELYAELHDLELVAIEVDAGASAKNLHRSGLQRTLARLEAGEASGLLVCKLDRLTRSVRDLGELVEVYFADRFSLLSVADSIDTRSAAGRLVLNVLASVSQWEREATGERTAEALRHIRDAEGATLGAPALGQQRTDRRDQHGRRVVAVDHGEQATVSRMIGLRAAGETFAGIAGKLTAEGRRTKRGGSWHASTVRAVLARIGCTRVSEARAYQARQPKPLAAVAPATTQVPAAVRAA